MNTITKKKLEKYFSVTKKALELAKNSKNKTSFPREDFLDMISRYYSDAEHFYSENNYVNAFACLNYAHGWLDAGARIGLFDVKDSSLFTVDD